MTSITSLPNATLPLTGTERVPMDQTVGSAIAASALVVGTGYRIESVGTTNWQACGLPAEETAAAGLTFVATAAGTGTGTAIEARTVEATTQAIANLASAAAGTVTNVALSAPTGFSVSGSPVTTTGTLALSFAAGYSLPTDARQSDWDAAFTQRRTWDGGDQHLNAATGRTSLGLTNAATATIGTAAGNLVALDGSARLPAVDGSLLTGLVVGDSNIAAAGLSQASLNGRSVAPFAPSTAYLRGDLVSLFGLVYRRKTAGTSGATFDPAMWDLQSAADNSNDCFYKVGAYINPSIAPTVTGLAVGQNTIFFYPFRVLRRGRVSGVQVRVTTAAASTTFQLAVYASSAARVPTGLPLASTTDMSLAAASAVAASISPIWLDPNQIYFRAINVSGSSTGVFVAPSPSHPEAVSLIGAATAYPSSANSNLELSIAWTYGTWPDMTTRTTSEGSVPRVSMSLLVSELG
jgi:hypothetical protein